MLLSSLPESELKRLMSFLTPKPSNKPKLWVFVLILEKSQAEWFLRDDTLNQQHVHVMVIILYTKH